jgi:hypothetical protein
MIKDLPCRLSPEELTARASEAAELHLELVALREAARDAARARRDEISEKEERADELARSVRTKVETRSVACEERFDDTRCCVSTVRLDTLEVVSSRTMTNDEKQRRFPFSEDEHRGALPDNVEPIKGRRKRSKDAAADAEIRAAIVGAEVDEPAVDEPAEVDDVVDE